MLRDETAPATHVADSHFQPSQVIDFIERKTGQLRDGGPLEWRACNEVTRMLIPKGLRPTETKTHAVAWAIKAEVTPGREMWFGRIARDFSFGPTNEARAKAAVEAKLFGRPFEKAEDERSWSGSCWTLLGGSGPMDPHQPAPLALAA